MPAARALVLALWPLAARADFVRGTSLPSRAVAEEPLHRGVPRRLQGFEPSTGAEGLQWTAPAQPAPSLMATPVPAPMAGSVLAPTSPLVVPGMLQHFGLDCWTACGEKAGYCKWCGDGNSCCRRADPSDPEECKTASVFLTLHHECVQTLPPAPTLVPTLAPVPGIVATASPTPPPVAFAPQERSAPVAASTTVITTAQVSTTEPIPTGPPTAAPPQQMVPAAEVLLGTTVTTTLLPPTTVPPAATQALTAAPLATIPPIPPATLVPTTTTLDQLAVNELYQDRRDRFIRAPAGRATWFQDAQTLTKHLVRFRCKACGDPPPCHDYRTVSKAYLENLTLGEDFQCELLDDPSPHGFHAAPFPTTTFSQTYTTTWHATSTTTTTTVAAGALGGWSWFAILGLVLLVCCCGAVAVAVFMAMSGFNGGRKTKKKNRTRGVKEDTASNGNNDEDQVPLVFGQEDPAYANASFSSHMSQRSDHSHGHHHGHREHAAAMAPTYTAMTPQMAQGPMNAQMAMQAQMPTQTNMQQMPLTTTPWVQPQPMQPTQVMPGTYTGLPTQAALAPPMQQVPYMPMGYPQQQGQEMELVTVTPGGLAVTPLAPGQQLPPGVPVVSQQNLM